MKGKPTNNRFRYKPSVKIGDLWFEVYSYQSKRHIYRVVYGQGSDKPVFLVGLSVVKFPEEIHKSILKFYGLEGM